MEEKDSNAKTKRKLGEENTRSAAASTLMALRCGGWGCDRPLQDHVRS